MICPPFLWILSTLGTVEALQTELKQCAIKKTAARGINLEKNQASWDQWIYLNVVVIVGVFLGMVQASKDLVNVLLTSTKALLKWC